MSNPITSAEAIKQKQARFLTKQQWKQQQFVTHYGATWDDTENQIKRAMDQRNALAHTRVCMSEYHNKSMIEPLSGVWATQLHLEWGMPFWEYS